MSVLRHLLWLHLFQANSQKPTLTLTLADQPKMELGTYEEPTNKYLLKGEQDEVFSAEGCGMLEPSLPTGAHESQLLSFREFCKSVVKHSR